MKKYIGEEYIEDESSDKENVDEDEIISINKFIISESVNLFKEIIASAIKHKCNNLFNISYGLKNNSSNEFYQKKFVEELRNIILNNPVFEHPNKSYMKCEYTIIPYIDFDAFSNKDDMNQKTRDSIYKNFYCLVSRLNYKPKSLMKGSLCMKWVELLWPDFKHKFDIRQLMSYISKYEDIYKLPFRKDEPIESRKKFLYNLIDFFLEMRKRDKTLLFGENNVFLNKNNRLVSINNIFEFDWNDKAKEIIFIWMNIVELDYKNKMLSDELEHIYQKFKFEKYSIESGIHAIEDKINNDNSACFMKYVIEGNEKRELMFKFYHTLLDYSSEKVEIPLEIFISKNPTSNINDIINNMFRKADELMIVNMIEKIHELNIQDNIDLLYEFAHLCKQSLPSTKLEYCEIIPNKNFKLCKYRGLSKDLLEDDQLKNILKKILNLDLNDSFVHDKFNDFVDNKINLNDVSKIILESINKQGDDFINLNKCDLFKIILQYSINEDFKNTLISIFKFFFKVTDILLNTDCKQEFSSELTKKIIELMINDISKFISKFNNIQEFAYHFQQFDDGSNIYQILQIENTGKNTTNIPNIGIDKTFKNLSDIYYLLFKYNFPNINDHKIFPNLNNDLQYVKDIEIVYDSHVNNDILFQLLHYYTKFTANNECIKTILHKEIPINDELEKYFKKIICIIDLDWFAKNIRIDYSKQDDIMYTKLKNEFYDFIINNERLRGSFVKLIDEMKKNMPYLKNSHLFEHFDSNEKFIDFLGDYKQDESWAYKMASFYKTRKRSIKPANSCICPPLNPSNNIHPSKPSSSLNDKNNLYSQLTENEKNYLSKKYERHTFFYEKLKNNPKYSDVTWPILSETKTDFSFTYYGKTYYVNPNNEREDYDIYAKVNNEIIYFKIPNYFPFFLDEPKHKQNKKIVLSYVDSENEVAFCLKKID